MAYTTINKSTDYFNTKLYTGTGSNQSLTGVGFQPDLIWWKCRNSAKNHGWTDAVRGNTKIIRSNETSTETTATTYIQSFDSDGTTIGSNGNINSNGDTFCLWNWKANGAGSANTDGSISSTVSANTTSGFSISQYTGTGSAGATVGHGLGVAPKMIIVKGLTYADVWIVGGDNLGGWNKEMYLNYTNTIATNNNAFNGVAPTSSVFTLGSGNGTNKSGDTYIAYCFAEKQGFSKFGSYTGSGSTDGTFVYTGFKPAWFMLKRTDGANSWQIFDNKRDTGNALDNALEANDLAAEATGTDRLDFLSQGVKLRTNGSAQNASGGSYIYMAFGQSLVGTNGVTAKAR